MKGTLDRASRHQACWRHQRRAHHGREDWEVGAGNAGRGGAVPACCPCCSSCWQHGGRAGAPSYSQWNHYERCMVAWVYGAEAKSWLRTDGLWTHVGHVVKRVVSALAISPHRQIFTSGARIAGSNVSKQHNIRTLISERPNDQCKESATIKISPHPVCLAEDRRCQFRCTSPYSCQIRISMTIREMMRRPNALSFTV